LLKVLGQPEPQEVQAARGFIAANGQASVLACFFLPGQVTIRKRQPPGPRFDE
jgi:hypothetical protein